MIFYFNFFKDWSFVISLNMLKFIFVGIYNIYVIFDYFV